MFYAIGYGGGIKSLDDAKAVFDIGFLEKVAVNSAASENDVIEKDFKPYGSQAVIASIDVKKNFLENTVRTFGGTRNSNKDPVEWAKELESRGWRNTAHFHRDREGLPKDLICNL